VRILAAVFALFAIVFMVVAIAGMVTGHPGARGGMLVRLAALACFGVAVGLNVAAH